MNSETPSPFVFITAFGDGDHDTHFTEEQVERLKNLLHGEEQDARGVGDLNIIGSQEFS